MINDIGDKDNVILNDMDESIGYYKDLYAMFVSVVDDALAKHDSETAQEQVSYLVELDEWKDYDGLLVLSMNNGMGFTAKPYKGKGE